MLNKKPSDPKTYRYTQAPPKSRGWVGLVAGLFFVGAMIYTLAAYAKRPPMTSSRPVYVEVDLQGPQHEEGRITAFRAEKKRLTTSREPISEADITQTAESLSQELALDTNQTADFVAGYRLGVSQAQAALTPPAATPVDPQK